MSKPKETYSTRKAWGMGTETDAQVELFERLAAGLRKEKQTLKKEKEHLQKNFQKKLAEKNLYIEQLENKLESVSEQLASYENEKAIRLLP